MNLYLCGQNGLHMYQYKYVFAQLMAFLDRNHFNYLVRKYGGNKYVKHFTCWNQLFTLMFGQLSNRDSLRDLTIAIEAHHQKCYHLGLGKHVTRSNLSKANTNRDCRIFEEYAYYLVNEARRKRVTDIFKLDGSVYAFDSTTISLCLDVFWWTKFRKHKVELRYIPYMTWKLRYQPSSRSLRHQCMIPRP